MLHAHSPCAATSSKRTCVRCAMLIILLLCTFAPGTRSLAQADSDRLRRLQNEAIRAGRADWGYWGTDPKTYYNWTKHSNRLVPVYTFGIDLKAVQGDQSVYRSVEALKRLYGAAPAGTVNSAADYFDQTDLFRIQTAAADSGKRFIILIVLDGLDWHTTRAAAVYRGGEVYWEGRGRGLRFQDYRGAATDFGCCVTSPHNEATEVDVNSQTLRGTDVASGGYDPRLGGDTPWSLPPDPGYLLGWNELRYHAGTDSANAATAMVTGVKSYNGALNVDIQGGQLSTIAHRLQQKAGFAVGVVTSVPISHATPAAAYAHNVTRDDYQDLTRDLLGLPSIAHPHAPLSGVDVLLGAGWGDDAETDTLQGENFIPGNKYLTDADRRRADVDTEGRYVVVERTAGQAGVKVLSDGATRAVQNRQRLLGVFGVPTGHLPYQTANGDYQPARGISEAEQYTPADLHENPTLADMTRAALAVLSSRSEKFWLMVEAGDVDWASHDVNLDNVIGSVLSGDEAFAAVVDWVENRNAWNTTAVIVTSDHGHSFVLTDPHVLVQR